MLHAAAHAVQAGQRDAAGMLIHAARGRRAALAGSYASALTPLRWDASIADSMMRIGQMEEATRLIGGLLGEFRARQYHDPVLLDGLELRARLLGLGLPPRDPGSGRAAPSEVDTLLGRLHDLLEARS